MKEILIVDDEEDVLFSVKTGFENKSDRYSIQTAMDGEKCLKILNKKIPDLILLDLMMPNMNGWQVLDILRGNLKWRDIPIFIITAVNDDEFKKTVEELGVTYIEKPFTIDELTAKVDSFFNEQ